MHQISQDDINNQMELLEIHRNTLRHYLKQQAQLGTAYIPPGVSAGILEARQNIYRIKILLRSWGIAVDDKPDENDEYQQSNNDLNAKDKSVSIGGQALSTKALGHNQSSIKNQANDITKIYSDLQYTKVLIPLVILVFPFTILGMFTGPDLLQKIGYTDDYASLVIGGMSLGFSIGLIAACFLRITRPYALGTLIGTVIVFTAMLLMGGDLKTWGMLLWVGAILGFLISFRRNYHRSP